MMRKNRAIRPKEKPVRYLKYGFVVTEFMAYHCPKCSHILNAGPNYQPRYCDQCGQKVTFKDTKWIPDKDLGFERQREDGAYEPVKN